MVYTTRIARKDRTDGMGNIIKKGEKYLDKGFSQIEKLHINKFALPHICPKCDRKVEHDLDLDCHCQTCDFDFRDIWNFIENRPQEVSGNSSHN